jgi:hypothetical protein
MSTTTLTGNTITETTTRELGKHEFFCNKCNTVHTKSAYAIAQATMRVRLVFSCPCGNKINL